MIWHLIWPLTLASAPPSVKIHATFQWAIDIETILDGKV
jgi:hypothetical protein